MTCSNCQFQNEPNAKFCGKCGTPLTPGGIGQLNPQEPPAIDSQTLTQAPPSNTLDSNLKLKKQRLLVFIVLTVITLGAYSSVWLFSNKKKLNSLVNGLEISDGLVRAFLAVSVFGAAMSLISMFFHPDSLSVKGLWDMLQGSGEIVQGLLGLVAAFKVRAVLNNYLSQNPINDEKFSAIWTFIFNFFYLQHKINKLLDSTTI